jgi:hypothetical protein
MVAEKTWMSRGTYLLQLALAYWSQYPFPSEQQKETELQLALQHYFNLGCTSVTVTNVILKPNTDPQIQSSKETGQR